MKAGMLLTSGVAELFRQEFRMFVRDRRALFLSLVLPVVVMPLLMFGSSWVEKQRNKEFQQATYDYAIVGPEAEQAGRLLAEAATLSLDEGASQAAKPTFKKVTTKDPAAALANSGIQFYVEANPPKTAPKADQKEPKDSQLDRDPEKVSESDLADRGRVPVLTIHFRGDKDLSSRGAREIRARLLRLRLDERYSLLQSRGFDFDPANLGAIDRQNLASEEHASGVYVGRFLTLFVLLFLMVGGAAVAIDSIAGEKERGTLETLLTTSLGRREIIAAKMFFVLAVALSITGLQVLNLLVYVGFKIIELPQGLTVSISPVTALTLLVLYLPIVFLVSAILLLISGMSKSYKEAQLYFMPAFFITLAPSVVAFFPTLKLRSAAVLLPIGNLALGIKELLVGEADWPMLIIAWLVTGLTGVYVARRLTNTLSQERLVTASELDVADLRGGPALYPRHVFRWFGLMWALMMLLGFNAQSLGLKGQILTNVVGIFFGGSLFLLWRYRLNTRETLSLRLPHPAVWPAVILGIPAAVILGQGVFRITNFFVPAPKKMIESFGQFMLPPDVSLWQLLFFVAVLPGICEEVAFRGLLLHGLRSRYRSLGLVLVVGGIFGFFHGALFRIPTTAFLGMLLTGVTLLSGSLYPAMLWHAGINATAVLAGYFKLGEEKYQPWHYIVSAIALAVCFGVFWIFRRPAKSTEQKSAPKLSS